MNFEHFKYFLDAYGASLRRWPADARTAAQALVVTDQTAAAALAEAERLDRALDVYTVADDPAAARRLVLRIAARAASEPARRAGWFGLGFGAGRLDPGVRWGALWPRAAALAIVMALGIVTGMFQTIDFTGTGNQVSASSDTSLVRTDENSFDVAGL